MEAENTYYLRKLRSEFEARLARNPKYSLRAFAKFIGMEPSSLSAVLRGKRRISKNLIHQVVQQLDLSPRESDLFKKSNSKTPQEMTPNPHEFELKLQEEAHFNIIAEWEHCAILSLMETKDFQSDGQWIAKRLGITETRALTCLTNLETQQMIKNEKGRYKLNQESTYTSNDIPSAAIQRAIRSELRMAETALDKVDLKYRDFSAVTFTLLKKDLPQIKEKIREFRSQLMQQAETQPGDEVYKLSVQLLPLTQINNN